ncbi:hypothetical protein IWW37_005410 [Coemansia sp. RSA 2050]|nr:hypothetical protein IWW37_005410 [Coemansia sp. RSA 2050]KAJ2730838.1 hypothetical protein IW152_004974 [Coemansia sp. BCRC 34962]
MQSSSLTLSAAEKFVDQYYGGFTKSSGKYYQPTTKVMWNGNGFSGDQFKTQILSRLQSQVTDFEVTGYDAHPLGDGPILISVSGTVKVDRKERFTQVFVIEKSGSLTYIQSDCFRIV